MQIFEPLISVSRAYSERVGLDIDWSDPKATVSEADSSASSLCATLSESQNITILGLLPVMTALRGSEVNTAACMAPRSTQTHA
jgi:hypothetical protein